MFSALQQLLSKYRFMESGLAQRRATLASKLPEINATLEMLYVFQSKADAGAEEVRRTQGARP